MQFQEYDYANRQLGICLQSRFDIDVTACLATVAMAVLVFQMPTGWPLASNNRNIEFLPFFSSHSSHTSTTILVLSQTVRSLPVFSCYYRSVSICWKTASTELYLRRMVIESIFPPTVFTPLGFVRLFGVVGGVLVKPQFLRDLNEEYYVYSCEEETLRRRLRNATATGMMYFVLLVL